MKKISALSVILFALLWCGESSAQNAITFWKNGEATIVDYPDSVSFIDAYNPQNAWNVTTYWKDGQAFAVYSPDSMFLWNNDASFAGKQDRESNVMPTATESFLEQLTSDEKAVTITVYSKEDSLQYDALAQDVLKMCAIDAQGGPYGMPGKKVSLADDGTGQEVIRTNGINKLRGYNIEQLDWNSGLWGNTRYGGFETYYNTMTENGKRYMIVVFYYQGGFPNKKTAYVKLGQVNSGPIVGAVNIYPGQEYAFIKVCIDDYLKGNGCANFFPLLITDDSQARNYLNPFLVKYDPVLHSSWRDQYFGYEFGTVNGVSVYYNRNTYHQKKGLLRNQSSASDATFQCVELCKRYIKKLNSHIRRTSDWGNANEWPYNRANDNMDQGAYLVFPNDGRRQVREGDFIVWDHSTWGHMGVVVKATDNYVSIAHQNGGVGTNSLPIGTRLKVEEGIVRDIKPGTDHSPIFGGVTPIPFIIRVNSDAESTHAYSSTMSVNTTNMNFGKLDVGESSTKSFEISNPDGYSTLNVSYVRISKGKAFSTDAVSCTIEPGRTKTFNVTFAPTGSGDYEDRIVIQSDADDNPNWTIRLTGTGKGNNTCPALVTLVNLADVAYGRYEDFPNNMYFFVNAVLRDMTDVEEWGVYFDQDTDKLLFAFDEVARAQSIMLRCSSRGENGLIKLNLDSFVAQYDDEVGVYVKKRDWMTGETVTLYGDLFSFSLRYDTQPSYEFSSPVIIDTKTVETDGDNIQYQTSFMFRHQLTGSFWIDYIDIGVSGGNWAMADNPAWYPFSDVSGDQTWTSTYWSYSAVLEHSLWRTLHLRNNRTLKSNYLNFKGDGTTITDIWVSSSPAYAPKKTQDMQKKPAGATDEQFQYVISNTAAEEINMEKASPKQIRKEISYKGGILGACEP